MWFTRWYCKLLFTDILKSKKVLIELFLKKFVGFQGKALNRPSQRTRHLIPIGNPRGEASWSLSAESEILSRTPSSVMNYDVSRWTTNGRPYVGIPVNYRLVFVWDDIITPFIIYHVFIKIRIPSGNLSAPERILPYQRDKQVRGRRP